MINKRLMTIAGLIGTDESVTDVGCDHGYLAIYLRQKGNKSRIICTDSKKGPLNQGRKNFEEAGYDDIETVLSDGLEQIEDVTDVVVMAGMGYHTVQHIMSSSQEKFTRVSKIIIQVNTDVDKMRRWLNENDYEIFDEVIMKEYKYYEILCVRKGSQALTEQQLRYGPALLEKNDEVFRECYEMKARKIERILDNLEKGHPDRDRLTDQLNEIMELILKAYC